MLRPRPLIQWLLGSLGAPGRWVCGGGSVVVVLGVVVVVVVVLLGGEDGGGGGDGGSCGSGCRGSSVGDRGCCEEGVRCRRQLHCPAGRSPRVIGVAWAAGCRSIHISVDSAVHCVGRRSPNFKVGGGEGEGGTAAVPPTVQGLSHPRTWSGVGGFAGGCVLNGEPQARAPCLIRRTACPCPSPLVAARCPVQLSTVHCPPTVRPLVMGQGRAGCARLMAAD